MLDLSSCHISVTNHPAEIKAARQLRYRVFFEELGDERYADHRQQEWGDDADRLSYVLNCRAKDKLIGSLRIQFRFDGPLWY